ncbi:hypothetical protein NE686_03685 [Tissierella carlieri]|uniref:Uncharacterized protein n=1 Tax=Tissierella carlieri TaxID=689904 RepID=A0ABT1S6T7_9FIRM|nr:hypothetical protein [Tissierella carlieri]MCQ4922171.1 hypothetical protein [Tissierella carlieri]
MSKPKFSSLPSGTTAENLLSLINILKKNNKNEDTVKAIFGMSNSVYTKTKAALKAFGIIESKSLDFTTDIGREIAFSSEENKKEGIIRIVKCYEPYELVLNSLVISRTDIKMTDIDTIKNLWGKAGFGSGDRNWNDGATFFMTIIDYIDFGKYIIGRGSNPTRIEWTDDIRDKISCLNIQSIINEQSGTTNTQEEDAIEANIVDTTSVVEEPEDITPALNIVDERASNLINNPISAVSLPSITINVDMIDWSEEKIKTFFKYAYGKFEED